MAHVDNPNDVEMRELLNQVKTIAVVGLSANESKASHEVAKYLQQNGYKIIPVNPVVDEVLGERSYPDLKAIPESVDLVDVFRRAEYVPEVADQAIEIGAKVLWLQLGITHEEAARKAREAGLTVIQDACMYQEHRRLIS
jgi:predicted CoA-binding protein